VDEALMVSVYALMVVKRLSKYVMENGFFSVGKVIVLGLGGDFRQVLPVVPHGSRLLTIQSSIKYSPICLHFKILKIFRNRRVYQNKIEFS
jgi:hypothetical protein